MTDTVKRLRAKNLKECDQAADEIERLRDELAELRAVKERFKRAHERVLILGSEVRERAERAEAEIERLRKEIKKTRHDLSIMHDLFSSTAGEHQEMAQEIGNLREALGAFVEHFGPLEDNPLLNDEVRRCFVLARAALKDEDYV